MKRIRHLALALAAAAMHLVAPVAAYAKVAMVALPGELCTASRTIAAAPASGLPLPASSEHHCAHAPCCVGGAVDAAAPPSSPVSLLRIAHVGESLPAANAPATPVAPIAAAQPRGPPRLA